MFRQHIFVGYLSWVQGAARSLGFLPWYPFWQNEKTCFSSCCTRLSREHYRKMEACSEKACSNICIKANTTFKGKAMELNIWFLKKNKIITFTLSLKMREPRRTSHSKAPSLQGFWLFSVDALCYRECSWRSLSSAICCVLVRLELNSDEAASLSGSQGQSPVGGRAEPDGRRRGGRRGQTRLLDVLQSPHVGVTV